MLHFSKGSIVVAVAALLLASCTHRYYAPNTIYMPTLRQTGDAALNVGVSTGPEFNGLEAHAAFSPRKHTALMVNYFRAQSDKDATIYSDDGSTFDHEWGKGHFIEGAIGGYLPLDERNTLSLFAGVGQGSTYNYFGFEREADLRFVRWFLQPSISTDFKHIRLGFGLRFAQLQFYKGAVDYRIDQNEREVIEQLDADSPLFLPEYALHFGWKLGAFTLSNTVTYSPSKAAQKDNRFAGSNLNLGLAVDVRRLFAKK